MASTVAGAPGTSMTDRTAARPLRIAWVYDLNACRTPTGVTRHALAQLDELRARRDAVRLTVVTGRLGVEEGLERWRALGADEGVARRRLPLSMKQSLRAWRVLGGPGIEAWTGGLDWVYCPAEYFVPTRRARVALTSHDVRQDLTLGGPRRQALLARLMEHADRVLSVSAYNTAALVEAFPRARDKVAHVPNAAEDLFFEPATSDERSAVRRDLGLPEGMPYLLSVANFQPRKNLARLVRAAGRLEEVRAGELGLVLLGTGDAEPRAALEAEAAALGSRAVVRFPGYREGAALRAVYAEAAALVFPSLCESFGIPVVEAMAQGCPVAIADSTALPEVAGDAGWEFDPESEEAIAGEIRGMLDDGAERARRVEAGRVQARRYRWSSSAESLLKALGD